MFCRFIKGATLFDNFYTTPQCAQTRAAVLTGRHHVRTGTMLVSSGEQPLNAMQNAARLFTVAGGGGVRNAAAAGGVRNSRYLQRCRPFAAFSLIPMQNTDVRGSQLCHCCCCHALASHVHHCAQGGTCRIPLKPQPAQ